MSRNLYNSTQYMEDFSLYYSDQGNPIEINQRLKYNRPVLTSDELTKYCRHIINELINAHLGVTVKPDSIEATTDA